MWDTAHNPWMHTDPGPSYRMSLLTLIILGECIIVIDKTISKIVKNSYGFDTAVIVQVVAAVLIVCKCRAVLVKEPAFLPPADWSSLNA